MDLIFKFYAIDKLFRLQNFSQIRETTIFCPFCHFGVKITNFSKMDFIFKLYAQKLFWVQNFNQIRETTIFCPFGVKITNFSIIIKCSQNRIDLQIVNTKTVLVQNFSQIRETTICCPFCHFRGQNYKMFKNGPHFQILQTKTVPGTKFQPNQRNYNILTFWGQNNKLFKNDKMFIEQNRFANCKHKNGSGCKISVKSE